MATTVEPGDVGLRRLPPSARPAFSGCLLSVSELETLRQMARGLTYFQAAQETRRSVSTVRSHLHTAYKRLGVSTISQALVTCTHVGWLDPVPQDGTLVDLADRRVTWAQRLYLEAFDQTLRAGDDPAEVHRTGSLREAALTGVSREAGKYLRSRPATADPLERMATTLQRFAVHGEAA